MAAKWWPKRTHLFVGTKSLPSSWGSQGVARGVDAEMIEGVVRGEERRGQIVVALGDKNVQERILRHGPAQRLRDVDVTIFIGRVVPRPHAAGQNFIG